MTGALGRDELLAALHAMDSELERRGVRAEIFIVGGAAMALAYDARRTTTDVDAIYAPASLVREVARLVGEDRGLGEHWLNDGAKAFMPGEDPDKVGVFEGRYLSVAAASARYLLAMKILASRHQRDEDDIRFLYEICGFTTAEEGLDLVEQFYPSRSILPRTALILEQMFPDRSRGLER